MTDSHGKYTTYDLGAKWNEGYTKGLSDGKRRAETANDLLEAIYLEITQDSMLKPHTFEQLRKYISVLQLVRELKRKIEDLPVAPPIEQSEGNENESYRASSEH